MIPTRRRRLVICAALSLVFVPIVVFVSWFFYEWWPHLFWLMLPGMYLTEQFMKWTGLTNAGGGPGPWLATLIINIVFWTVLLYTLMDAASVMREWLRERRT